MCIVETKIDVNPKRRVGYKVYNISDDMGFRGQYNLRYYTLGQRYKSECLPVYERDLMDTTDSPVSKGFHIYPIYPNEIGEYEVVVKVSFSNPIAYGISKHHLNPELVIVAEEIKLLRIVKKGGGQN